MPALPFVNLAATNEEEMEEERGMLLLCFDMGPVVGSQRVLPMVITGLWYGPSITVTHC